MSNPAVAQATRRSSLAAIAGHTPEAAAALKTLPPMARFVFRGRPAAVAAFAAPFGAPLPEKCGGVSQSDGRTALWLGPDEWLILAPEAETVSLGAAIEKALAGLPHSLVEVSHRQLALEISGPKAATVLNCGVPQDLDLASFPVGTVSRTVLNKAEIVLWRTGETTFHIEVWRSFAPYLWGILLEARREYAV